MSNSTSPKTDRRQRRSSRYWLWSAGIHAAALLLLVFCTPVREIVFEREKKKKPEITMRGEKLQKVIENIRRSEEDALRERVALLGLGVDRIRVNLLNKQRNNQGFEDAQRAAAFDRVLSAMRAAVAAQERKIALHARNVGKVYNPDDALEIQRQDVIARGRQDDIEAALPLLPAVEGLDDLIAAQKEASDRQTLAANFSRWTEAAWQGQLRWRERIAQRTAEVEAAKTALGEAATALADRETALAEAETALTAAEAAQQAADERVKLAERAHKDADDEATAKAELDQARKQRDQARKQRDQARKQRDGAKRALASAQRDRNRAASTLEKHASSVKAAQEKLSEADAGREKKDGELTWHAERALEHQQAVLERYTSLFDSTAVAQQLAAERAANPVELGPDGKPPLVTQPDTASTGREELLAAGLADLFDISDRLIAQAVTDYRAIRAIDLARRRDLAIATALEQIAPLDPLPTEVDTDLLRADITDPELVEPHKQEVLKVKASVEEKISLVEQLLKELETFEAQMMHAEMEHQEQTLEDLVQQETFDETAEQEQMDQSQLMEQLSYEEQRELKNEHMEAMAELAKEDEQQRMKDLTAVMKQNPLTAAPPPPPEPGEQQEGDEAAAPPPPPESGEQQEGDEAKPPAPPPAAGRGKELQQGATPNLDLRPDTPGVLARKITDDGSPMEWMYVDTWYTIGPFSNENRRNLNTKFPPETVVDLDAQYIGKDGRRIRWTFVQSRGPNVEPADAVEYAIYYAYTEIYSDRPRDVWVAVGSDDKANIWINDMPVWISGDKLKGWNIQEGYRKVHLREGINKVLYRVENGWKGVGFSMSIHTRAAGDGF